MHTPHDFFLAILKFLLNKYITGQICKLTHWATKQLFLLMKMKWGNGYGIATAHATYLYDILNGTGLYYVVWPLTVQCSLQCSRMLPKRALFYKTAGSGCEPYGQNILHLWVIISSISVNSFILHSYLSVSNGTEKIWASSYLCSYWGKNPIIQAILLPHLWMCYLASFILELH